MRRKAQAEVFDDNKNKTLIDTRREQYQKKMQGSGSRSRIADLPRSYSSPDRRGSVSSQGSQDKGYVMRSFSTPDHNSRKNSETFYRPSSFGSRSEIDSDLENFEQLEEYFMNMDSDHNDHFFGKFERIPELGEPKKVTTSLLPGSGIQKVVMQPIKPERQYKKSTKSDTPKDHSGDKVKQRFKLRPLTLKMNYQPEYPSKSVEELIKSPLLDIESDQFDRELEVIGEQMEPGPTLALEESDGDTVS